MRWMRTVPSWRGDVTRCYKGQFVPLSRADQKLGWFATEPTLSATSEFARTTIDNDGLGDGDAGQSQKENLHFGNILSLLAGLDEDEDANLAGDAVERERKRQAAAV